MTEDYTIERDSRNLFKTMSIEDVSKKNDLLKYVLLYFNMYLEKKI